MDGLDSRSPMARKVPGHPFFKFVQGSLHNNNNNNNNNSLHSIFNEDNCISKLHIGIIILHIPM